MKISLPCYLLWSDMCYLQYFLYTTIYCNCVVQITFAGLGIASILYVVSDPVLLFFFFCQRSSGSNYKYPGNTLRHGVSYRVQAFKFFCL